MANLANDIRLAVDSGKTAIGMRDVMRSINSNEAKLVILSSTLEHSRMDDIKHVAKINGTEVIMFTGNPVELGTVCGKPYSISVLSILEQGDSKILNNKY